jgi:hypothetical protein
VTGRWIDRVTPVRVLAAGGVAAALVVAAALIIGALPTPAHRDGADGDGTGGPNATMTPSPGAAATGGPYVTASPNPVGPRLTTEVPPGQPGSTLPPATSPPPVFVGTAPKSGSASGKLVAGFPAELVVPAGAKVASSSISTSGSRSQVTLDATVDGTPADALQTVAAGFAKIGLVGTPTSAVGGSTAEVFARGNDTVTVTVSKSGSRTELTVFAVLDFSS